MTIDAQREEWHYKMMRAFAPHFERLGFELPLDRIKIGVGYTSSGNRKNSASIGQCLYPNGEHKDFQITIRLDQKGDANVASTLLHELIHVALPIGTDHKRPFRDLAFKFRMPVDSAGRSTCKPGNDKNPEFEKWLQQVMDENGIGEYPHRGAPFRCEETGKIKLPKASTTVKFKCPHCNATASQPRKFFEAVNMMPLACNNLEHDVTLMEIQPEKPK